MVLPTLGWPSIKTRVTLASLAMFVLGAGLLALYGNRMLHDDLQRLLGQQLSTSASFMAQEVNGELENRLRALELIASELGPTLPGAPRETQKLLETLPIFQLQFNAGVMVTGLDATVTMSQPLAAKWRGFTFQDSASLAATLRGGKAMVGPLIFSRVVAAPVFVMAVPIRDRKGNVLGALVGMTDLGRPNFLDRITDHPGAGSRGQFLVAPDHRMIVAATDKSRLWEKLPAPGVSPWIDRFMLGYEGFVIVTNPHGVEVLVAVKRVPMAGWYASVILPTREAFAPIRQLQQRMLVGTTWLTLLMGGLIWWTMRRQLSPMLATMKTLAALSDQKLPPQPLPVTGNDEIGALIHGFNRLLATLKQREDALRASEVQLHQAQKMESLGLLAGGVAHDMNNVLGAILGLATVHVESQPPGSAVHRAFTTITQACDRGGSMIRRLLGFARQSLAENKVLDLNLLVRETIGLLEHTTLARVRLVMDLAPELRPIRGDASALSHMLMNLCVNAVEAMPDNGMLTLRTRNLEGGTVEVQVVDTGWGMAKEVLLKALDPFYTTKGPDKGTGLGLAIVHTTVQAHHGQLELHSEPGQGTQVYLRFPACAAETLPVPMAATIPGDRPGGKLQVLVIDDDELMQETLQLILEVLGHTPASALCGEEALRMVEAGYEPDVVILDMNMPGLGGTGTLPRLRLLRPALPVLIATGRPDQVAFDLAEAHPGVTLIAKPFGMRALQQYLDPFLGSGPT